jgi:predicted nucleic acid-binding protein
VRLILDASVAVAAAHPSEPTHAAALARVMRVLRGLDELVAPVIFPIEVAAALSRTGTPAAIVEQFVAPLVAEPTRLITIGPRTAGRIQRVAVRLRLRAADAAYVWLATREGVPLVTSDREMLQRGVAACQVERP